MGDTDVAVLAVDDGQFFLDVAREVVTATPGFVWAGAATSGEAAVTQVDELGPSLVLLDIRMQGMDGLQTARIIADRHPEVVIVLVSVDEAPEGVSASGAALFIRKQDFGPRALRRLWRTCGTGQDAADPGP